MVSEIIKYYWPKMIDLHNYMPANSLANKISNWETLNRKVLRKLKLTLSEETIKKLSASNMDTIHKFLKLLKNSVDKLEKEKRLILECSQKHPLYIIENEDMIQVETAGATCKNKCLDKETVKLVNRLKQNINDLEHKMAN
ncbi:sperm flagellar protein 1-like isoform X1 [Daktulosphaira vitifoliae]|uniref:sperm flagellar protein 1-like isoform X1 n=1 Tax=Daktulosphaira vitifoliae TaxID=58002 RepID=UPI0021AA7D46|nr:sperm flagellar protein 1-like isoform X1 [Daktulosphaira vitifoliae]